MAPLPDLSFLATVPEMATYHGQEASDGPFAIYSLCDFDEDDITEITKICDAACELEGQSIRPPRRRFLGRRLRDVVEYHVGLAREGQFDPRYFMVVSCLDWRTQGLVVVTLDDEGMQCKPDVLWIKADDAGLALINLQISNVAWEQLKEDSMDSAAPNDGDVEEDGDAGQNEDFGKAPGIGYHIGVCVRSNFDTRALLRDRASAEYQATLGDRLQGFEGRSGERGIARRSASTSSNGASSTHEQALNVAQAHVPCG